MSESDLLGNTSEYVQSGNATTAQLPVQLSSQGAAYLIYGSIGVFSVLILFECVMSCRNRKSDTAINHIEHKRHCTDLAMLTCFIIFCAGIIVMSQQIMTYGGNPYRFLYGVNIEGKICGYDEGYKDLPYAAWPYISANTFTHKICLKSCEETLTHQNMVMKYESEKIYMYCIPKLNDAMKAIVGDVQELMAASETLTNFIGDVMLTYPLLLSTPAIALVGCFLYLVYTKYCTGCMVLFIILSILLGFGLGGYFVYAKSLKETNQSYKDLMSAAAYTLWALDGILLLIVLALRKRIQLAIEVIKEASLAMFQLPSMLFFPFFPFLLGIAWIAVWTWVALYIFTVSKVKLVPTRNELLYADACLPEPTDPKTCREIFRNTNSDQTVEFTWDDEFRYTALYWVFSFFWVYQFLVYFTYHVLSGTVAEWYFSPRKDNGWAHPPEPDCELAKDTHSTKLEKSHSASAEGKHHGVGHGAVCRSCYRSCRYHLGSVAFGSLIIAIINTLRVVCKYIEHNSTLIRNERIKKAVFCMIQCCLKCLECCLDKISRSAYVWQAVTGHAFLTSACEAFITLIRNFDRVAAIAGVAGFILFLGPIAVGALTCSFVGMIIVYVPEYKDVSTIVGPMIIAAMIGIFVAKLFMTIYNTTIDTIFLCFLIDENHNLSGTMMAPISMQKLVKDTSDKSKKMAKSSSHAQKYAEGGAKVTPADTAE